MGYVVLVAGLAIPIIAAVQAGSTYKFAFSIGAFGVALYLASNFLTFHFIKKRAPQFDNQRDWETTAGLGIVPKWVSEIGLLGMGLAPSGLIVAALLFFDLISHR